MNLAEIKSIAEDYFPKAVNFALAHPGAANSSLERLKEIANENFERLGFGCSADLFGEIVPRAEGYLTLMAWSRAELNISGWKVNLLMRPFHLGASYVHFEIRHDGPIKGFTETGFRSVFTPLASLADISVEEYLTALLPARGREEQMSLF